MNLHAIVPDETQLLCDYLSYRFSYTFRPATDGTGSLIYATYAGAEYQRLSQRDALVYLNDARTWQRMERADAEAARARRDRLYETERTTA